MNDLLTRICNLFAWNRKGKVPVGTKIPGYIKIIIFSMINDKSDVSRLL